MEEYSTEVQAALARMRLKSKPFPLKELLRLYILNESWYDKNSADYTDSMYSLHFHGLRTVVSWLGPIALPDREFPPVHKVLINYEIQQMAQMFGCGENVIWHLCMEILNERYSSSSH